MNAPLPHTPGAAPDTFVRVLLIGEGQQDDCGLLPWFGRGELSHHRADCVPAAAALAVIERGECDVVLVDHRVWGPPGLELGREIQRRNADLPLILLVEREDAALARHAMTAGVADCLGRDELTPGLLRRTIRHVLRHAAMQRAWRRGRQQLELLLHQVPCAIAICDAQHRIVFRNARFAEHLPDFDRESLVESGGTPWILRQGERCWLVTSFPLPEDSGGRQTGIAATEITARVQAEEGRQRQGQLLDNLMRNLPVLVGRLDGAGVVVEAKGGLGPGGIRGEALVGQRLSDLFPQSREPLAHALRGGEIGFALHGTGDGREWHADFHAVGQPDGGAVFIGRDVTERRWLERRLLTVTEAEQQRIGVDLHDGLGQKLTGLACLATALRDRLTGAEAAQASLIAALANDATIESRAIARGLSPVQLEQAGGLIAALTDLVESTGLVHSVRCRLRVDTPEDEALPHLTAVQLYRIAQEAINNAVRHGRARQIAVTLTAQGRERSLHIEDDGLGFDDSSPQIRPGGLRIMEYRANLIGGTLLVDAQPGAGTRICCHFALADAPAAGRGPAVVAPPTSAP